MAAPRTAAATASTTVGIDEEFLLAPTKYSIPAASRAAADAWPAVPSLLALMRT
jgi:hypothetical protein